MEIWILLGPAHLLTRSWGKLEENTDVRAHQMEIWILLGPAHLLTRSWGKLEENTDVRAHQMEIWILLGPAHLLTRSWGKLKENTNVRAHQMEIWVLLGPAHLLTRSTLGKIFASLQLVLEQVACSSCSTSFSSTSVRMLAARHLQLVLEFCIVLLSLAARELMLEFCIMRLSSAARELVFDQDAAQLSYSALSSWAAVLPPSWSALSSWTALVPSSWAAVMLPSWAAVMLPSWTLDELDCFAAAKLGCYVAAELDYFATELSWSCAHTLASWLPLTVSSRVFYACSSCLCKDFAACARAFRSSDSRISHLGLLLFATRVSARSIVESARRFVVEHCRVSAKSIVGSVRSLCSNMATLSGLLEDLLWSLITFFSPLRSPCLLTCFSKNSHLNSFYSRVHTDVEVPLQPATFTKSL
ncbi:hypothetical protein SLEP1_g31653 [Rubroshorea leprosula]|uniref:Uncharacterized protein n=1 Tax=Rubroshorea leprosula TaxID=152421 RepID=A0AAV5K407_9ROSI|nr:hypothetical protein SLEP1_g31653 [Rubroshorea leprosula]